MNNSICTLFDNILIDIHKFKSLHYIKLLSEATSTKTGILEQHRNKKLTLLPAIEEEIKKEGGMQ